jgi:TRAP transporter TAXI family solute receptor
MRHGLKTFGPGLAIMALAVWFTYQFVEPAPPRHLVIATGDKQGAYYQFALKLQQAFTRKDIELEILETEGSVDNLERLRDGGGAQVGFMQSGIATASDHPHLTGLASVYYEPLWIFSNQPERLRRISDLNGLRVAIGAQGSGSRRVALQLFEDNGKVNEAKIDLSPLGGRAAANALLSGEIDAALTISSADAAMVKLLLGSENISLMSFDRAPAYERKYPYFSNLTLPEGIVAFERNIPQEEVQLVAAAATLVARDDLHPALGDLIMQTAADVFHRDTLFSGASKFPSADYLDFPLSADAERYYQYGVPFLQRFLPFWAANLIDRMKVLAVPLLALLLPLTRILPPAYRWSVRKKVYRWYGQIQLIDQSAVDNPDIENLELCQAQLLRIEREARDVDVPLGYTHELYALRQHIDLLKKQIHELITNANELQRGDSAPCPRLSN